MKNSLFSLFAGMGIALGVHAQPPRIYDTATSTHIHHVSKTAPTRYLTQHGDNTIYVSISLTPSKKSRHKKNKPENNMSVIARKTD